MFAQFLKTNVCPLHVSYCWSFCGGSSEDKWLSCSNPTCCPSAFPMKMQSWWVKVSSRITHFQMTTVLEIATLDTTWYIMILLCGSQRLCQAKANANILSSRPTFGQSHFDLAEFMSLAVQLWWCSYETRNHWHYMLLISSVTLGKHFLLLLQDAAHNDALVGWGIFGFISRISPLNLSLSSTVRIWHITASFNPRLRSVQKRFQQVLQQTRFVFGPPETW